VSGALPGLILSAGTGMVFIYGGYRVVHNEITVGTFVAFIAYQTRFQPPLQALMGLYASLATAKVSLARVSEILDAPLDVSQATDAQAPVSVIGQVEFSEVTLSFDRGRPAVERLSFRASPGEVLAIVGTSGSGKSTVADLLLRLLDPDEGVVRLDGIDLRRLNLRVLRHHVALVDQDPCLLHASIAENIRTADPMPRRQKFVLRRGRLRSIPSSTRCRRATRRWWANAAPRCRRESASVSRRRGRFSRTPRC
jgi:ATP-binding cassette subfamily B protein